MNQKEELSKERILQAADQIVVLSEGKVAEAGSPADLYADENSLFRHMTQLQNASAGCGLPILFG